MFDSLRQPLKSGEVAISRANHRTVYPARFQLVAAMNPCRCGHANEPGFACKRQPNERCMAQYQSCLSGPLLDRIDIHIELAVVTAADLVLPPPAEDSAEVAKRVAAVRERRRNATRRMASRAISPTPPARLRSSTRWRSSTGRSSPCCAARPKRCGSRHYHRVIKLARTLADLEGDTNIGRIHLAEALSYPTVTDRVGEAA